MSTTAKGMPPVKLPATDRCRGLPHWQKHQTSTFSFTLPPLTTSSKNINTDSSFDLTQTYLYPFFPSFFPLLCFYSWCLEFNKETERMRMENIFELNTMSKLCYPDFLSCRCTCVNAVWHDSVRDVQQHSLKLASGGWRCVNRNFPLRQPDTAQTCTVSLLACLNCKVINSYCFTVCWKWLRPNL